MSQNEGVGYPRIERNADGVPIIDIGPYGGMATCVAVLYTILPDKWPNSWPDNGVIHIDDPRVGAACKSRELDSNREFLYYQERELEGHG